MHRLSDARLIELARRGDEDAFSCLVDRYRRELLIYAHRLLGAQSRGEDALQQALFGAWLALRDHDREVDNARAWLYRSVHNAAVTILRRAQHETITLDDARNAGACTPDADRRTELSAVITELGRLPETERRALIMTSVSGASHEEAAETLGVSRAAVRGMVYRARTSLRTAVGGLMPWGAWNWLSNLAGGGGSGESVGVAAGSAGLGAAVIKGGAVIAALGAVGVAGDRVLVHHTTRHAAPSRVALRTHDAADPTASSASRQTRGAATRNAPSVGAAHSNPAASFAAPDRGDRPGDQPASPAGSPGRDEHHGRNGDHGAGAARHGGRPGTGSSPGGPGRSGRGGTSGATHTSPTSGPPTTTSPTSGPPTTTSPRSGSPTTTQPTTTSSPGGPPPTTTTSTRGGTDDPGDDDHGTTTSAGPTTTTTTGSGRTDTDMGSGRPAGAGRTAGSGRSPGGTGTGTVAATPTTTGSSSPTTTTSADPTTTAEDPTTTVTTSSTPTPTVTSPSDGGGDRHGGDSQTGTTTSSQGGGPHSGG